jgi:hypothetical protein
LGDVEIHMSDRKNYLPIRLSENQDTQDLWTNYVYVSYKAEWEGMILSDNFLWPMGNRSVHEMKVFAVGFLADNLG